MLICVAAVILILGALGGTVFNPYFLQNKSASVPTLTYNETLTKAEAMKDINYVKFLVGKVYPACVKGMAVEFQTAYERETALLKDEVTINELHQFYISVKDFTRDDTSKTDEFILPDIE